MLPAVASAPCQEYVKDKFLTHVPAFPSSNSFVFFPIVLIFFPLKILYCIYTVALILEVYSEPS